MKKLFLYSSVFAAAALMTACSNDEPINNNPGEISDGTPRYLSVNIVNNSGSGTRAEGDVTAGDPGDAEYEQGLNDENAVSRVRFYFFDAQGNPASVKANRDVNWYDWIEGIGTPDAPDDIQMPNVEKILNATIVISTKDGDTFPSQMLAVVNPRADLGDDSYKLEEIRLITADYATYANGGQVESGNSTIEVGPNHFPMCNSVYADGEPLQRVTATKISPEHYKTTAKDATDNPVQIYVERNVAKVRTAMALDTDLMVINEEGMIKLQDKEKNFITLPYTYTDPTDETKTITENKQVYLNILGWNVTADMNQAYLSKRLSTPLWTDETLGFVWNWPDYKRSYWAFTYPEAVSRYDNYNAAKAKTFFTTDKKNANCFTYCNENTVDPNASTRYDKRNTKVIVAGTLCDEDGKELTLCEYYGIKFVDDDNQTNLKKSVLNYLTDNGVNNYYRQIGNEVVSISPADITFQYEKIINDENPSAKGGYYVIPTLTADAMKYRWFSSKTDLTAENQVAAKTIDEALEASQHAKIWNKGMTYYFTDINHFGTDKVGDKTVARRGVVRNHIYDMAINTIYGLGTPVWDPDKNIIPEKTEDEDTYIGAQINILSWRIVNNKVNFEW